MKKTETTHETWPELDEAHRSLLSSPTHQAQNSSMTIDMTNSNELPLTTTKDEPSQPFFDTQQQQSTS